MNLRLKSKEVILQGLTAGAIVLFYLGPALAQPQLTIETRTLGQFYEDRLNDKRFPFSNYLLLEAREDKYGLSTYMDGRFFADLANEEHQFDIYQGSIVFDLFKEDFHVEAGRFPILNSFDYISLDGARLSGMVFKQLHWDVFGGWTRDTVLDVDRNTGKVAGAGLSLRNEFGLRNRLQFLFEDYESGAEDQRIGFTIGRDVFLKNRMALDGGAQFSFEAESISQGFLSADTFFSDELALNFMYYYEDPLTDRSIERDQIYALFASSGVHGVRPTVSIYFTRFLQVSPYVEWTFYEVKNGSRENAYQVAIPLFLLPNNAWKVDAYGRYTFIDSPGGTLHFLAAGVERNIWRDVVGRLGGELVWYNKINQDRAVASRAYLESAFPLTKNIELTSNLEANSNEDLERELRFMFYLKTRWQGEL